MPENPDFEIKPNGRISKEFLNNGIKTFHRATNFIRSLPYGRNSDKNELTTIFSDHCGTCGTKHAILKQLADENDVKDLSLTVGLFKMNGQNTPEVATTLQNNNLEYIPEAHCYLKYKGEILDYTKPKSKPSDFIDDLIEELEILPHQISDYKVIYHRNYLTNWLKSSNHINLSLSELWTIREQCIQDLAEN